MRRSAERLGLMACLTCGLLFGGGCTPPTPSDNMNDNNGGSEPRWKVVLGELPAGLLSISGTGPSALYAVGADTEDGRGPLVLRYNGTDWTRLATGAAGDLWWITDRMVGDSFFLGGEGGLILRYRPADDSFEPYTTPGQQTMFGVWGVSPDNVVAVGGEVNVSDTDGVIWRFDGASWVQEDLSSTNPDGIPTLFKVWGRSPNEVYACGARGTVLRYDGTSWTKLTTATTRTLFTVYGNATRVASTGGAQSGVIVELSGDEFVDVTPAGLLQMNGVFVPPTGEAVAVGREGAVSFRGASGWRSENTGLNLDFAIDYHAAWIDPEGGVWAVGGNIVGEPQTDGVITYFGTRDVGTELIGG